MVRNGLSASGFVWAFTNLHLNWHPLTWLSHMLDVQLFGLNAGPQHLVNVALHIGSALLLFVTLVHLTGKPVRCAAVAGIFALHPLHVESVAWIAERKDVLSTFFEMLTLLCYARYAEKRTTARYALVASAFACSLMAKPMAVSFPFVLLLLDYWPLRRSDLPALFREKIPLFVMSAATAVITVVAQRSSGEVVPLAEWPFNLRLANAAVVCVKYIGKAIWPRDLAVLYPLERPSTQAVLLSLLALAAITVAAILSRKRRPYFLVGWLWYLGMLVPVLGLVQAGRQSMADRYTYLPLVGLSIALTWAVADAVAGRFLLRALAGASAIAALIILSVAAYRQTGYWRDSETLYEHALAVTRGNYIIANNLGVVLVLNNRPFEAMTRWEDSLAIRPDYAQAHANLGHALLNQGRLDEAFQHLSAAMRLDPGKPDTEANLATVDRRRGNLREAARLLEDALPRLPDDPGRQNELCFILQRAGNPSAAVAHCREALRLNPVLADARVNLDAALGQLRSSGKKP